MQKTILKCILIHIIYWVRNMNKKEEFKRFASLHPELIKHVKNNSTSWQQLYEIYDIYGTDANAWDKYLNDEPSSKGFDQITKMVKNVDMDSIQKHINTAQKALGFISELTSKSPTTESLVKGPLSPRPLNKFFED